MTQKEMLGVSSLHETMAARRVRPPKQANRTDFDHSLYTTNPRSEHRVPWEERHGDNRLLRVLGSLHELLAEPSSSASSATSSDDNPNPLRRYRNLWEGPMTDDHLVQFLESLRADLGRESSSSTSASTPGAPSSARSDRRSSSQDSSRQRRPPSNSKQPVVQRTNVGTAEPRYAPVGLHVRGRPVAGRRQETADAISSSSGGGGGVSSSSRPVSSTAGSIGGSTYGTSDDATASAAGGPQEQLAPTTWPPEKSTFSHMWAVGDNVDTSLPGSTFLRHHLLHPDVQDLVTNCEAAEKAVVYGQDEEERMVAYELSKLLRDEISRLAYLQRHDDKLQVQRKYHRADQKAKHPHGEHIAVLFMLVLGGLSIIWFCEF